MNRLILKISNGLRMKKFVMPLLFIFLTIGSWSYGENELVSILYRDQNFIEVKGRYFYLNQKELPFSMKKGELFVLSNENIIPLEGESYQVTIDLTSLKNNQTASLSSTIVNETNRSRIEHITEKKRYIVEGTYDVTRRHFDCNVTSHYPCWDVYVDYEVVVENGLPYALITRKREFSEETAINTKDNYPSLFVGDEVEWGHEDVPESEKALDIQNCHFNNSKIFHTDQEIEFTEAKLIGMKRKEKKYRIEWVQNDLFEFHHNFYFFGESAKDFPPLTRGVELVIASEEVKTLEGTSYQTTIGLVSPLTKKIHYFESILTDNNEYATIDKVIELSRSAGFTGGGNWTWWHVQVVSDVILKDGTKYRVTANFPKSSKKRAKAELNKDGLIPGDKIFWGPERGLDWLPVDLKNITFEYSKIYRYGRELEIDKLWISGFIRRNHLN